MPSVGAIRQKRWAAKTATGCVTCRKRRVKCDEGKPFCQRCENYGAKCGGYAVNPTPRSIFSSAQELYRLHKLPDGAIVGMVNSGNFATPTPSSDLITYHHSHNPSGKIENANDAPTDRQNQKEPVSANENTLSLVPTCNRSFDAVDPTRSSALSKVPEAAQVLSFWQSWTSQSPSAPKCFAACVYDDTSLTALLSVASLMMQYSNVCEHATRTTTALTVRSLKSLRHRLSVDPSFFLTEPGLNAFSWQMLYAWLSGDTNVGRIHLMGLVSVLRGERMSLTDLPDYIQEILVYCDFVSSMLTLQGMAFVVPESLTMEVPRGMSADTLLEMDAVYLLARLDTFKARTLRFDIVQAAFQGMLTATRLYCLVATGELPCSAFIGASYTFFKALSLVLPFAFFSEPPSSNSISAPQPSKQNTTAYLGMLVLLWGYVLCVPLGVLNAGGLLVYPPEVMVRLPPSNVPKVAYALEQLNSMGIEARAAVAGSAKERISVTRATARIINILEEYADAEFSVLTVISKRYVQTILSSPIVREVMEYRNPALEHRLRFFGQFVGRWCFVGAL